MVIAVKDTDLNTITIDCALQEPDCKAFIKAMIKEIEDYTKYEHWEIISINNIPYGNKPINAVLSMKRKQDPDGSIIK